MKNWEREGSRRGKERRIEMKKGGKVSIVLSVLQVQHVIAESFKVWYIQLKNELNQNIDMRFIVKFYYYLLPTNQ